MLLEVEVLPVGDVVVLLFECCPDAGSSELLPEKKSLFVMVPLIVYGEGIITSVGELAYVFGAPPLHAGGELVLILEPAIFTGKNLMLIV